MKKAPHATPADLMSLRAFEARDPETLTHEEREEYRRVWCACMRQAGHHLGLMVKFAALGLIASLSTFALFFLN